MSSAGTSSSFGISLDQNSNSNATPSPTEPLPLPHPANLNAPLKNQAFMEAVASLSHAADILSNAAKAISSAVESLMLAGAHSDCANFFMQTGRPCSPESRTKDWLARNYSLNPPQVPNTKLPSSSLLFENAVVAAQQGGVGEANANGLRHASPRAHESDPESSLDGRGDISQLDLTERGPALLLNRNRESPSVDEATPLPTGNTPHKGDQLSDHESIESDSVVNSPQSQASSLDSSGGHITEPEAQAIKLPIQLNPNANNLNTTSSIGFGLGSSSVVRSHVPSWNQLNQHQGESRSSSSTGVAPRPQRAWNYSQQHVILEEDFDVIPLICHLANFGSQENTLCYVQDVKMFQELEHMINELVTKPVYMLVPGGPKGPKNAAGRACESSEGCLVFCSVFSTPLPATIRHKTFHSVIQVGWMDDMDRYEEQLERDGLRRATLILTQEEFDEADLSNEELREAGYGPCPTTATYNSLTSNGKFSKMRKQWKEELSNDNYGSLCRCFEAWIEFHYSGPHERTNWSAIDVANKANTFAKTVLLHGNAKVVPRNPTHPIVGRRLSVTSQFVSDLRLEEAVRSKILVVEEFDD